MEQILNMLAEDVGIELRCAGNSGKLMHPIIGLRRKDVVPRAPAPVQEIDVPCRSRRPEDAAVGLVQPTVGIPILLCARVGYQCHS